MKHRNYPIQLTLNFLSTFAARKTIFEGKRRDLCLELCFIPGHTSENTEGTRFLRPENALRFLGFMIVINPTAFCDIVRTAEIKFYSKYVDRATRYNVNTDRNKVELVDVQYDEEAEWKGQYKREGAGPQYGGEVWEEDMSVHSDYA